MQHQARDHNSSGLPSSDSSSLAREERDLRLQECRGLGAIARMTAWKCASDQARLDMVWTVWRGQSQSMLLSMACPSLTDTPVMDDGFRVPIVAASAIRRTAKQTSTWAVMPSYRYMAPQRHADAGAVLMKRTSRYKKLSVRQSD